MFGWLARGFLIAGGVIAGWFVAPDANNFEVIRMVAAILLFVACAAVAAFWPRLKRKTASKAHKE